MSEHTETAIEKAAARHGGKVVIDTITEGPLEKVAASAFPSCAAYLAVYVPTDVRICGVTSTTELTHPIAQLRNAGLAVSAAGGISRDTIDEVAAAAGPAIVVVRSAITTAQNP